MLTTEDEETETLKTSKPSGRMPHQEYRRKEEENQSI